MSFGRVAASLLPGLVSRGHRPSFGCIDGSVYARLQKISERLSVPVQDLRSTLAGTPGCSLAAEFRLRHKQLEAAENVAVTERYVPNGTIGTEP